MDDASIHAILSRVLASGALEAGIKLKEHHLAQQFDISRDRMRRILHRLGHEKKIELVPNRGARTISPGLSDARTVYEARRILEGGVALAVVERLTDARLAFLRKQYRFECEAVDRGDSIEAIRLGGAFHMSLAGFCDNVLIIENLQGMVDRTSALLNFFGPGDGPACSCREHGQIIDALGARDPLGARDAMCAHLSLVETRLRTRPRRKVIEIEILIHEELAKLNQGNDPVAGLLLSQAMVDG